jgi:hypothetical protein
VRRCDQEPYISPILSVTQRAREESRKSKCPPNGPLLVELPFGCAPAVAPGERGREEKRHRAAIGKRKREPPTE